jgi:hypothetical protein
MSGTAWWVDYVLCSLHRSVQAVVLTEESTYLLRLTVIAIFTPLMRHDLFAIHYVSCTVGEL